MLILGHIGFTVGGCWLAEKVVPTHASVDYRAVAVMALAPDIIDRFLFVFVLPEALSGRLLAHTLLVEVALVAGLMALRRSWWIYGVASAFHLLLDTVFQGRWLRHALWPLLGGQATAIGLTGGSAIGALPYGERVLDRMGTVLTGYWGAPGWMWLFELVGTLVLLMFAHRNRLFQVKRLQRFVLTGSTAR